MASRFRKIFSTATRRSIRCARPKSTVLGQREQLRYTEQNTLLNALTFYMNVMRDTATLDLNNSNVEVLKEQLRQTRDRFNVGEVTRTDVAQAEASLAQAQANYLLAENTLQASIASYRQTIGDQPRRLAPVTPVNRLLPTIADPGDRHLAGREPRHHRLSARRRRRAAQRQDQRGGALSDRQPAGVADQDSSTRRACRRQPGTGRHAGRQRQHPDLRRRRDLRFDPPGQGAGQPAGADRGLAARQGAPGRGRRLVRQPERARRRARREGAGAGGRSGARGRARGGQGRPAHDA